MHEKGKISSELPPYFVKYHQSLSSLINMSVMDFKGVNKHRKYDSNTILQWK
jgi:hypothetical protein